MRGFWIYILITTLLVPCIMLVFGILFYRNAPKKINIWYGYRTSRSMINEDTWSFAHHHLGRAWMIVGAVLFVISIIPMLAVLGRDDDTISMVSLLTTAVQLVLLIASIIPTERALKNTFDENGNRK